VEGSHGSQGKGVKERDPRRISGKKWTKNGAEKGTLFYYHMWEMGQCGRTNISMDPLLFLEE
jgi:hypothetical protein